MGLFLRFSNIPGATWPIQVPIFNNPFLFFDFSSLHICIYISIKQNSVTWLLSYKEFYYIILRKHNLRFLFLSCSRSRLTYLVARKYFSLACHYAKYFDQTTSSGVRVHVESVDRISYLNITSFDRKKKRTF